MNVVNISAARRFSLESVQRKELAAAGELRCELLCFEAGQIESQPAVNDAVYQVLEGEALFRRSGQTERLGKGKLLVAGAGDALTIENAGGGLLVVLCTACG
ncbi:MAG: hypothetical protein KF813_01040 [Trueperaceae bacterium]|nr:hypothetical protein [Trueperaceae bacterium]